MRSRLFQPWIGLGVGVALAAGCAGDSAGPAEVDGGTMSTPDARPDKERDAGRGAGDAGFGGLAATPETADFSRDTSEGPPASVTGEPNPRSCYDGRDNEGSDKGVDCNDPGCQSYGACCVGHGDCCTDVTDGSPLPRSVDIASCAADGGECDAFGAPRPRLDGARLAPGGDTEYDSGAVIGGAVDASVHRIRLSAVFHGARDCGPSCLDSAGMALTAQKDLGTLTHVRAAAGLLRSDARDRMYLLVADEIVDEWRVPEAGSERWTLIVRPSGSVIVERDGVLEVERRVELPRSLRAVVYGRSRDRATAEVTRVSALRTATELCDIPDAWRDRARVSVVDGGGGVEGIRHPTAPSIAEGPDSSWLAFEDRGRLRVAQKKEDGTLAVRAGLESDGDTAYHDPDLLYAEGTWYLYYAAGDERRARIQRYSGPVPSSLTPDNVLSVPLPPGAAGLDAPTVMKHRGRWVMIARAHNPDGAHHFALFVSDNGTNWRYVERGQLDERATVGAQYVGGSGVEEIDAPTLMVFDHAWHLYYAQRRGARWSIAMLASDELLWWRAIDDGKPVLEGSSEGFDRLGVSDPATVATEGGVALYYVGHDGTSRTLARTHRPASDGGTFE